MRSKLIRDTGFSYTNIIIAFLGFFVIVALATGVLWVIGLLT